MRCVVGDHRLTLIHLLNLVDCVCTMLALSVGVQELNPIMRVAIEDLGLMSFVLIKVSVVSVAAAVLGSLLEPGERWILSGIVTLQGAVVAWHVFGLLLI